jgi:hypothetical protein
MDLIARCSRSGHVSGEAFDNHALAALRAHAGAWHCMLCWAREANLHPAEDLVRLRLLARRLRFSRDHELTRAGRCDRCGGVIKDDVLVREGTPTP